jgi:hypothetical protein
MNGSQPVSTIRDGDGNGLGRTTNMSNMMNEFTEIDPNYVTKLREAGIENTDDMLRVWADQPKRQSIVEQTGITMEQFTTFASMARLARVKNVGTKYVEVLLAAGIDGPKSLFEFEPEALARKLGEVKMEKNLTGPVPPLAEISTWFKDVPTDVAAV